MSNSNSKKTPTSATAHDIERDAEILFQKIYDKWYAFSVVDDEAFMTEVTEDEVMKRKQAPKSNA